MATSNEKVIGYAIFYYTYSTWHGKVMYLEDLCVTKEFRGKHIGSKLLKSVAKVCSFRIIYATFKKIYYEIFTGSN